MCFAAQHLQLLMPSSAGATHRKFVLDARVRQQKLAGHHLVNEPALHKVIRLFLCQLEADSSEANARKARSRPFKVWNFNIQKFVDNVIECDLQRDASMSTYLQAHQDKDRPLRQHVREPNSAVLTVLLALCQQKSHNSLYCLLPVWLCSNSAFPFSGCVLDWNGSDSSSARSATD